MLVFARVTGSVCEHGYSKVKLPWMYLHEILGTDSLGTRNNQIWPSFANELDPGLFRDETAMLSLY